MCSIDKSREAESRGGLLRGWGEWGQGVVGDGPVSTGSLWGDEKVQDPESSGAGTASGLYQVLLNCTLERVKMVNFMSCVF